MSFLLFFRQFITNFNGGLFMEHINFNLTKNFVYQKCVERVEKKRTDQDTVKPQIALCRDDKSLVSFFFNCKTGPNNKYLVTKRLLNYHNNKTNEDYGAVPVFGFKDEHEVLWGNETEFNQNLFTIFSSLIKDILDSQSSKKDYLEYILSDNIIYAKYLSFHQIKEKYQVSLSENFAIWDYEVDEKHMIKYLDIAIQYLYDKPHFKEQFKIVFLTFTNLHDDYTHIDERICKELLPDLYNILEKNKPSATSLGIRVKTLIETDIIKALDQLDALKYNSDFLHTPEFKINKKIINASSKYICDLENIALSALNSGVCSYGW